MLEKRQREPEEMDDPAIATGRLHGALSGLSRLNVASASARIVWPPIAKLACSLKPERLRILDIATGAGDIPIAIWRRGKRAGLNLEIYGIDVSSRSIEFARSQAAKAQSPIAFECRNALADDLPNDFDVVMCSLFLHHLGNDEALKLLQRMHAATRRLGLVSDLRRSSYGLFLAFAASRLLSRSQVVHVDAVRSVRAAFTKSELEQLAAEAGLENANVSNRWPARMLLSWRSAR
jgi:2-polyprenyl-3-methyl-5-hydroxy-6-metoxy-1,4-benzoquinol methylase